MKIENIENLTLDDIVLTVNNNYFVKTCLELNQGNFNVIQTAKYKFIRINSSNWFIFYLSTSRYFDDKKCYFGTVHDLYDSIYALDKDIDAESLENNYKYLNRDKILTDLFK